MFFTAEKETVRQRVFAAVIDLDTLLRADLDAGDHLHPDDAGNRLIAESIALQTLLALLRRRNR